VTEDEQEWLAQRFEEHRGRLRAVAYRMLGSTGEADAAVQEAWLRLARSGAGDVENLGGWLTTVVARVSLNMLRARSTCREVSLEGPLDEPARVFGPPRRAGSDSGQRRRRGSRAGGAPGGLPVGLALLVVLETLSPQERPAFVLHDTFGMPFAEIARIVDRPPPRGSSPAARRRVRSTAPIPDADLARHAGAEPPVLPIRTRAALSASGPRVRTP